ncbi:MAG: glycosyltransferase family 4 protein [Anaerobutyricum soehngenii]
MTRKDKVIINGRFLAKRVTGVERYGLEILLELDKISMPNEFLLAVPPEVEDIPKLKNIKVIKVGKLHNRAWEHISFAIYTIRNNMIPLNFCNVAPLLKPGIVVIHDVKFKARPEFFSKKFIAWYNLLFTNAIKRAKRIITVSEFSKSEIQKYFNISEKKIYIVPSAWTHFKNTKFDELALEKYHLEKKKFFFSMSSLEPNKNFHWVAEVAKKNPKENFAIAGSINETVFADGLGFSCPSNMHLLGYISDAEAKTLMKECKAFLFPTFYEGFGLPPMEAISAGCEEVIISDTRVMHDIYGKDAIYIDPNNYNIDLSNIDKKYNHKEELLKKYTWEKSARRLLDVLRTIE